MANFIRSTILDARTMGTEVFTLDLPVNPISHLILTVEGYNATNEATIAEILADFNSIRVRHTGVQIIDLESEDLAALNLYLYGSGGLALAPLFATILAVARQRMPISGRATGWFFVGSSAGGMAIPWLIGQLIEAWGPTWVFVVVFVDAVLGLGVCFGLRWRRPAAAP